MATRSIHYEGDHPKRRTAAYLHKVPGGVSASRETYAPIRNEDLVRSLGAQAIGDEYLKIGAHVGSEAISDEQPRRLYVVTDTILEMNNLRADLRGDALFVFNALAASRGIAQKSRDVWTYGNGFRNHIDQQPRNLSTYFSRAVQALDAWSREVSERDLVYRTNYGSGQPIAEFMLNDDLQIIDTRPNA